MNRIAKMAVGLGLALAVTTGLLSCTSTTSQTSNHVITASQQPLPAASPPQPFIVPTPTPDASKDQIEIAQNLQIYTNGVASMPVETARKVLALDNQINDSTADEEYVSKLEKLVPTMKLLEHTSSNTGRVAVFEYLITSAGMPIIVSEGPLAPVMVDPTQIVVKGKQATVPETAVTRHGSRVSFVGTGTKMVKTAAGWRIKP